MNNYKNNNPWHCDRGHSYMCRVRTSVLLSYSRGNIRPPSQNRMLEFNYVKKLIVRINEQFVFPTAAVR